MKRREETASTFVWLSVGWSLVSAMGVFLHILGGEAAPLAYFVWGLHALFIALAIYFKRMAYLDRLDEEYKRHLRESKAKSRYGRLLIGRHGHGP